MRISEEAISKLSYSYNGAYIFDKNTIICLFISSLCRTTVITAAESESTTYNQILLKFIIDKFYSLDALKDQPLL